MNDQPTTPPPGSPYPSFNDTMLLGPPPEGPPAPMPSTSLPTERPRRRTGLAVAVVATSLVIGGAAGVGGAAAWDSVSDDAGGTGTSRPSIAQVTDTPDAPAADGSVESVAAKVLPSVVKINVTGSQGAGSGSGIVLTEDGTILTNNHVIEVAAEGGSISVSFNDGTSAPAEILGADPLTDTAVIKAEGVSGLTPATIGKSGDLRVGESVVAIGSPFGLDSTVTSGIVSALNRPVDVGSDAEGNSTTYPAIQTDAAINPGNSGGALVDMNGNVVGINSSIRTASTSEETAGSIGLGFAIPIDAILPIVDQMSNGEAPTHARLGISVSNVADETGAEVTEGAQIQEVSDGSTAAGAGLAAGDVITKIDDHLITSPDSLVATIRAYRPGDEVTVTYISDGEPQTVTLTLDSDAETSSS